MGATSGPGAMVSSVNASPPCGIGRHSPAKQNQSSPAFVNFHFVFGDFVPVNSKKCEAGDQTAANRKTSPLGSEIDDRRTFGPCRREAPTQLRKLVRAVFQPPDN